MSLTEYDFMNELQNSYTSIFLISVMVLCDLNFGIEH